MIIHQITDLHVPDDESKFPNIKPNILRQLAFVADAQPDLLVISGDLTMQDRSRSACQWLYDQLPEVPTVVIPGNHDDANVVREVFGDWAGQRDFADASLLFVDTSSSTLPDDQIAAIDAFEPTGHGLLFMHHPPYDIGAGYMNINWSIADKARVTAIIQASKAEHVFCGHFHNDAALDLPGFKLFLTPSPAFQVALNEPEFTEEPFEPGVRVIRVSQGSVDSSVVYLPAA